MWCWHALLQEALQLVKESAEASGGEHRSEELHAYHGLARAHLNTEKLQVLRMHLEVCLTRTEDRIDLVRWMAGRSNSRTWRRFARVHVRRRLTCVVPLRRGWRTGCLLRRMGRGLAVLTAMQARAERLPRALRGEQCSAQPTRGRQPVARRLWT
jgi:hypothetical protein